MYYLGFETELFQLLLLVLLFELASLLLLVYSKVLRWELLLALNLVLLEFGLVWQ